MTSENICIFKLLVFLVSSILIRLLLLHFENTCCIKDISQLFWSDKLILAYVVVFVVGVNASSVFVVVRENKTASSAITSRSFLWIKCSPPRVTENRLRNFTNFSMSELILDHRVWTKRSPNAWHQEQHFTVFTVVVCSSLFGPKLKLDMCILTIPSPLFLFFYFISINILFRLKLNLLRLALASFICLSFIPFICLWIFPSHSRTLFCPLYVCVWMNVKDYL